MRQQYARGPSNLRLHTTTHICLPPPPVCCTSQPLPPRRLPHTHPAHSPGSSRRSPPPRAPETRPAQCPPCGGPPAHPPRPGAREGKARMGGGPKPAGANHGHAAPRHTFLWGSENVHTPRVRPGQPAARQRKCRYTKPEKKEAPSTAVFGKPVGGLPGQKSEHTQGCTALF